MILICYILSILCGAAGDGLMQHGKKLWGHPIKLGQPVFLLMIFVLSLMAKPDYTTHQIVMITLSYFALRFALWDYAHNIAIGQYIFYIGNTSYYDLACQKIHPAMINFMKFVFGVVAIIFLIL